MSLHANIPRRLVSEDAPQPAAWLGSVFAGIWNPINGFLEWFGELGIFVWQVMRATVRRPFEGRELIRQLDEIGSKSLPMVALAGAAIGAVLALESRYSLIRFGAKSMLPAAIVFSIIHETGPVVTGLVVSGRVGAGIGAELGSMKVTEQIDAIEASGVNPYKLLAFTRILACILMLPLLTLAADFAALLTGWIADTLAEPISFHKFIHAGFGGRELQRFSGADFPDGGVRLDHRGDRVLSGNAQPGRHRRRGAFGDEFGGLVFAFRDAGRRDSDEIDPGVLPMTHMDQTATLPAASNGERRRAKLASRIAPSPAMVLQGLQKSFGAQKVLNGIDLTVGEWQNSGGAGAQRNRQERAAEADHWAAEAGRRIDSASTGRRLPAAIWKQMNEIRKKMGFLFQHAALYDSLTVAENVAFPLRRHTKMTAFGTSGPCQGIAGQRGHGSGSEERCPAIFRAGCRSGSDWRARWLWNLRFCCSMNPRRGSIRLRPARSMS